MHDLWCLCQGGCGVFNIKWLWWRARARARVCVCVCVCERFRCALCQNGLSVLCQMVVCFVVSAVGDKV